MHDTPEKLTRIVAVTGATGFAGGHAVAELLRRGHHVRALVRSPSKARMAVAVEMVAGDLDNGAALDRLITGADAVIHLAGAISALKPHDYFRINAHGTVAVAETAVRAKVARFVHVSSLSAREPDLSSYGASKRAGEDVIAKLMVPLNAVIIRPPAVYGPGDRATLPLMKALTQAVAVIPGNPMNRFSLIHVSDLARMLANAAVNEVGGINDVSDGTPGGYCWADLLAVAAAERGKPVRPLFLPRAIPFGVALAAEGLSHLTSKPGMVSRDKVRELYHADWTASPGAFDLDDAIRFARGFPETLAWYRAAGWLPRGTRADRSRAEPREEAGP